MNGVRKNNSDKLIRAKVDLRTQDIQVNRYTVNQIIKIMILSMLLATQEERASHLDTVELAPSAAVVKEPLQWDPTAKNVAPKPLQPQVRVTLATSEVAVEKPEAISTKMLK